MDSPPIIFLALFAAIAAMRWPFAWTGNEENYFLVAHRLIEPDAYGPFDAAFDDSRGKCSADRPKARSARFQQRAAAAWPSDLCQLEVVPTNSADIYRWYGRIERRRELFQSGCPADPRIGALIVANEMLGEKRLSGELVFRDERAAVIALRF